MSINNIYIISSLFYKRNNEINLQKFQEKLNLHENKMLKILA